MHEENLISLYDKDKLIYLTGDSNEDMEELERE
jgi:hypothetical protein